MIPVTIRTYKGSSLATAISVIGTLIDAIVKLIGVMCAFCMIEKFGLLLGILVGFVFLVASSFLGGLFQKGAWKLADMVQLSKIKGKLSSLKGSVL